MIHSFDFILYVIVSYGRLANFGYSISISKFPKDAISGLTIEEINEALNSSDTNEK